MLYLTRTMISSVDLACYEVSRANDWVSVDCCSNESETTIISNFDRLIVCSEREMKE